MESGIEGQAFRMPKRQLNLWLRFWETHRSKSQHQSMYSVVIDASVSGALFLAISSFTAVVRRVELLLTLETTSGMFAVNRDRHP